MNLRRLLQLSLLALGLALSVAAEEKKPAPRLDTAALGGLAARPIGPAAMSGRIMAIEVAPKEPRTIWVGAATGGVWKSTNGGTTFKSLFDKQGASIGAIAIDPKRPSTVWVGTGESCTRNSSSVGNGLWKTTDGGESWTNVGLEKTERIAKILVDPKKPDTVFVAAPGHQWDASPDRGLYRTTDGGKSFEKVLFVDDATGVSDVALDPAEPSIVYAASWQFRRTAWSFTSGGPGSAIWKSTDGGTKWRKVTNGLPAGTLGRIALAVAPSRPSTIYAAVEAKKSALYRSDDFGESWKTMSASSMIFGARPFYFSHLAVDPTDWKKVWKPGFFLAVSNDGGDTFSGTTGSNHGDHHALWIDPADGRHLLLGTDGGVYESDDGGGSWRFFANLPVSQFYRVAVDDARPYNVYGGLQDNGSWQGPSRGPAGVRNKDWKNVGWGDGFATFPDRGNPDIVYAEYQGGHLLRRHRGTGETKEIRPFPETGAAKYRFNWNTPFLADPKDPKTIWVGAQYVLRSTDRGDSWNRLSPDLTTNDPAKQKQEESGGLTIDNSDAEKHCTVTAIAPSPLDPNVVWAGTDDGNLQVTRDGGKAWTNVAKNFTGLPPNSWVTSIEASRFDAATAYATFDGHWRGDMTTYVFRTTDAGKSWANLGTADLAGFAHVVREDPVRRDLLFLGTESGLFVSIDGGAGWAKFGPSLPVVPVRDLVVQPREGDLVVATHGRGIWIVDDLTPLRALDATAIARPVAMLPSRPAVLSQPEAIQDFPGDEEFVGDTLADRGVFHYYLRERHLVGDLSVEVLDAAGKVVAKLPGGKRRGINRVEWTMRGKPPRVPTGALIAAGAMTGPALAEGSYTIRLTRNGETFDGTLEVVADPRLPWTKEERARRHEAVEKLYALQERIGWFDAAAIDLRDQARGRAAKSSGQAAKTLEAFAKKLDAFHASLAATREGGMLTGEEQLRERVVELYGAVSGFGGAPGPSQLERLASLTTEADAAEKRFRELVDRELPPVNGKLDAKEKLKPLAKEEWEKRER